MTRPVVDIRELLWSEENEESLDRLAAIRPDEAEDVVFAQGVHVERINIGSIERYAFLASTRVGRNLVIFVEDRGRGIGYVTYGRNAMTCELPRWFTPPRVDWSQPFEERE